MIEALDTIGLDPLVLIQIGLVAALVFLAVTYRHLVGLFDPLSLYIVAMVSNCILVYGLPWDPSVKWSFAGFVAAFWLGFIVRGRPRRAVLAVQPSRNKLFELYLIVLVLFGLLVILNLILGFTAGFPLLSDNPSHAKVESLQGGLGAVRRINQAPFAFFCAGCSLLVVFNYRRLEAVMMMVCASSFVALSGSKSALLVIVYIMAFIVAHTGIARDPALVKRIARATTLVFAAALLVAVTVLARDHGNILDGFAFLALRLLYSGDVILFYYPNRVAFLSAGHYDLFGYFHYLFAPTLGMLRLIPYEDALGTQILGPGNDGFGPNVQFFIRADIFFGPIGGCLYAFIIGNIVAYLRKPFLQAVGGSPLSLAFKLTIAVSAFTLAAESALFMTDLFDLVLLLVPLWMFSRFVCAAILTRRRNTRKSATNIEDAVLLNA